MNDYVGVGGEPPTSQVAAISNAKIGSDFNYAVWLACTPVFLTQGFPIVRDHCAVVFDFLRDKPPRNPQRTGSAVIRFLVNALLQTRVVIENCEKCHNRFYRCVKILPDSLVQ
jgi:hypothetical protein